MASVMLITCGGCKKKEIEGSRAEPEPPVPTPTSSPKSNVVYRDRYGCRVRTPIFQGHTGPAWNTYSADCPPDLADAGDLPSYPTRPPGKESWLRLKSSLSYQPYRKGCSFTSARLCTPQDLPAECTKPGPETNVACTYDEKGGRMTFESFVYTDGLKLCHRVTQGECKIGREGSCDLPTGDDVPCPPVTDASP